MTLHLRPALASDAPALTRFLRGIAAEKLDTLTQRPDWTPELTLAWLTPKISGAGSFVLLALDGEDVVGALDLTCGEQTHYRHSAYLGMSVSRDWRGRGVGRQLLEEAIQLAQQDPLKCRIELHCAPWNTAAVRLYESVGFVVEAVRRKGINLRGQPEADLTMVLVW